MGGESTPNGTCFLDTPTPTPQLEREKESGGGEGHPSSLSPRKGRPPHGKHSCRKMKNILLFEE